MCQILEKEHNSIVFGVDSKNLMDTIKKNNPDYLILSSVQYEQNKNTILSLDQNSNTKIITLSEHLVKNKNISQIVVSKTKFILYNEYYKPKQKNNDTYMVCDMATSMDNIKLLESLVYPKNKKDKIRLLNCPELKHVQNVGVANEDDMLDLIYGCDTYINVSDRYLYDAIMMNKKIINLTQNRWPKSEQQGIIMTKPEFDLPSKVLQKCLKI